MKTLCKDLLLLSDEDIWLDIGWEGGRKKYIGKVPWANFPSRIVPEKCSREKTTREKLPKTWAPTKSPPEKIPLDNYFWILELMLILIKIAVVGRFFEHWIFRIPPLVELSFCSPWFAHFCLVLWTVRFSPIILITPTFVIISKENFGKYDLSILFLTLKH